jgi:apolipoprotein N-acyltransferase
MAFANNHLRIVAAVLIVLSTSALIWFGNGLDPCWPLFWFAPLPLLVFALRSSWRAAALTAFLPMLLGSLNMWHYFQVLEAPAYVWFSVYLAMGLLWTGAVLLFRALVLRGDAWSALLAFPATWVAGEYLRNFVTPHGTAGSLAYTQLKFLPFLQLTSITGPWGMSFVLLLFPAGLAIAWHLWKSAPRQASRIGSTVLTLTALVLIFGWARLRQPAPAHQVTVGLIASDTPANVRQANEGVATERLFRDYSAQAEQLAEHGAQVIVLPEKTGTIVDPTVGPSDAVLQSIADKTGSTIVAGVDHIASPARYNEARIYQPKISVLRYDKHHMLPPFEDIFKPGTTITLLNKLSAASSPTWGVAICKDMDFTQLSRAYGNSGAGLLLVPGWDFNVDRSWHGHIAIMRGVESGFSIAHAAKNGYLTVSDDRGRIVAETRSDSAGFATLLATVPDAHEATPYLLLGDWFAWLSIAIFAWALIQRIRLRDQIPQATEGRRTPVAAYGSSR